MTLLAIQTTMTVAPATGAPGMLYDITDVVDIITKRAEVAIPFGAFVTLDADGCKLPGLITDVQGINRGIALFDPGKATTFGYQIGDMVQVLVQGRCWIQAEPGVTISAYNVPYARYTANGSLVVGSSWRADTDTTRAAVPLGMSMFATATSGGMGVVTVSSLQSGPTGPTA